jgi:CRISPR-associated protein Cas2
MKKNYLVGYDIADPRRLKKVADVMTKFGVRVQYSFFHVFVSNRQKTMMKEQIKKIIKDDEDQIIILPVSENQLLDMECIGLRVNLQTEGIIVV